MNFKAIQVQAELALIKSSIKTLLALDHHSNHPLGVGVHRTVGNSIIAQRDFGDASD